MLKHLNTKHLIKGYSINENSFFYNVDKYITNDTVLLSTIGKKDIFHSYTQELSM